MNITLNDVLARRRVRVIGEVTGELVWINRSRTRVKVRTTDINGHHRHLRVPIEQVEAL